MKKWLSLGNLTSYNGITNYALTWLVIFYLQVKYNIPSISALIKINNQSKIISGKFNNSFKDNNISMLYNLCNLLKKSVILFIVNCKNYTDFFSHVLGCETGVGDVILNTAKVPELQIEESKQMHKLLLEFFRYYGSFDYMHCIICPLLGKEYSKESFTEVSTLPDSMKLYVAQLQDIKPEYFRIDSPMCVQDPFDLSHNLTKAVPILTLKRFKHYCNESASLLRTIVKKLNNI